LASEVQTKQGARPKVSWGKFFSRSILKGLGVFDTGSVMNGPLVTRLLSLKKQRKFLFPNPDLVFTELGFLSYIGPTYVNRFFCTGKSRTYRVRRLRGKGHLNTTAGCRV